MSGKNVFRKGLRTRFAPTPSGYLHIGNAFSMVLTWLVARQHGGKILLRIDDIDNQRVRTKYLDDVFQSLEWLGLDYDEGPSGTDDFLTDFSQQKRLNLYSKALEQLKGEGLVFGCTCSRSQIRKASKDGKYPGTCLNRQMPLEAKNTAWRFNSKPYIDVKIQEWEGGQKSIPLHENMPFFVVRKKDGKPAYQLASLVDDLHFKIDFIVRGMDLLDSTAAQIALGAAIKKPSFTQKTQFLHHPLITDRSEEKLSKSAGAVSLRYLRESKISSAALWKFFARIVLSDQSRTVDNPTDLLNAWEGSFSGEKDIFWEIDMLDT